MNRLRPFTLRVDDAEIADLELKYQIAREARIRFLSR